MKEISVTALADTGALDLVVPDERFQRFVDEGRKADQQIQETRQGYGAEDVHDFLKAKVEGRVASRPKPVQWRK